MKDLGARGKLIVVLLTLTTMLGCGALEAGKPAVQQSTGLAATSSVLDFGTVAVGDTVVRTNTVVNRTNSPIVLTRAQIDQTDFSIAGQNLPLTLEPGQKAAFQIVYAPRSDGSSQGTAVLASNLIRWSTTFSLRGTAIFSGRIRLTPASISFGNVPMGTTQTQSATLSNSGRAAVTITNAAISGQGFALTRLSLPLTLNAGQNTTISVSFTPASGGSSVGKISLIGSTSISPTTRPRQPGWGTGMPVALRTVSTTLNVPVSGTGMATATAPGQLAISPSVLALGSVRIGASQSQSATLINSGSSNVNVSQATVTGRGFRMSGLSFPMTLTPGQRWSFTVTFAPQSAGTANGSIAVTSDASNSIVSVPVSAVATPPGALLSNPSSFTFGSVQVGHVQTLSGTLTNSGGSSLTVSQANVSGSGFAISGLNLPAVLTAGQSATFSVTFSPQSGASVSGALNFASDASALTVPLAATGVTAGSLISTPSSLSFGAVQASGSKTLSQTLTNTGGSTVTITQANVSGAGFTMSGLSLPANLAAGQSTTFSLRYDSQSGGAASGSLSIASNASNATLTVPLVANAAVAGVLSASDSSLNFASVQVGGSTTLSETLTNSGGSSVTVTQANVSGTGFRVTGLSLPLTLNPGQSFTFGALFNPTSGGNAAGTISVVSDASNSTLTISLAGTATVPGQLAVSPATLNFGNVTVGQAKSLTATLTASGSNIAVSGVSMSTSEFTVSGISLPLTLAAGQSASFTVSFTPQSSGAASASASFTSNASNSSAQQSLTGSGIAAVQHSVSLTWSQSSSSTVVAYNIYRGVTSGGPYSKIQSLSPDTTYTDSSVQGGQTYSYVVTAVDAAGRESPYSNQVQAVVPTDVSGTPPAGGGVGSGTQIYTTNFPLTENGISENGKWINGGTTGLDWTNMRTTPGFAFGTIAGANPTPFDDSVALLSGSWGNDQTVNATVRIGTPITAGPPCYQESEIFLRGNISAHGITGYEVTVGDRNDGSSYIIVVRWEGGRGKFTILASLHGAQYGVKTGDQWKATIVGNVITAYINGVQKAQVTDSTYSSGKPGMGMFLQSPSVCGSGTSNFGYSSYTAVSSLAAF